MTPAPLAHRQAGMGLHTADGLRKHLTAGERDGFLPRPSELNVPSALSA